MPCLLPWTVDWPPKNSLVTNTTISSWILTNYLHYLTPRGCNLVQYLRDISTQPTSTAATLRTLARPQRHLGWNRSIPTSDHQATVQYQALTIRPDQLESCHSTT